MTENNMKLQYNFQPMPKRFMVWDKHDKTWLHNLNGDDVVFADAIELGIFLSNYANNGVDLNRFVIVQSTNLFDQNGKEIFEGSVLYLYTEYDNGLYTETETAIMYVVNDRGEWVCHDGDGNVVDKLCDVLDDNEIVDICGHILESPDLNALKIKLDNAEVDARKEESEALGRFVESIESELVEEK